jgi:hypothetical protein
MKKSIFIVIFIIVASAAFPNFSVGAIPSKTPIFLPQPPASPSHLAAVGMSSSQIGLAWHDNSNDESGFKIERSLASAESFSQIASTSPNITAFFDTTAFPNTTYQYRIRAYNAAGDSHYSNIANATTFDAPTAPSNLVAGVTSAPSVFLIWQDNSSNETGFRIERSVIGPTGGFLLTGTTTQNTAFFTDDSVLSGVTYWYRVAAFNATGTSLYSNIESVTIPGSTSPASLLVEAALVEVPSQNISQGANQILGGFKVTVAGEPITVDDTRFRFSRWSGSGSASSTQDITNIRLIRDADGMTVAGPVDINAASPIALFTDTVTYPIGTGVYKLVGRVESDYANNDTIAASTTPEVDWMNARGINTNQIVIPTPNTSVTGSVMTVKTGALAVSTLPTPITQTIVAGTQNFNFANFSFDTAGSGEDVRLNAVQVEFNFGQANSNDDLTNCQLWDGANALNTGTNVVNGSNSDASADDKTFTFDSPWAIPKNSTRTLALKCNTTATTTTTLSNYNWTIEIPGDADDMIPTGVTSGSTITEVYDDTTGQMITLSKGGALAVTLDTQSSPSIKLANANTVDVLLSAYRFTAVNEPIKLTQVGLMLGGTASNSPQDITKATLWSGSTKLGEVIFAGDTATATLSNGAYPDFVIPKDSDSTLTVKADIATIGISQPALPGHLVRVEIDPSAGDSAGNATRGIGLSSGNTVYSAGTIAPSNGARIMRSVPTLAKLALSSTKLVDGTIPLYRFSVSAPSSGAIGLYKFTYTISTSTLGNPLFAVKNLEVRGYIDSSFTIPAYTNGDPLNFGTAATNEGPGSFGVYFDPMNQIGIPEAIQVPAGQIRYFELVGTVTNMSATSSTVVINLQGDATYSAGTNKSGDNANNFIGTNAGNYAFATTAANIDFGAHDDFIWSDNATTTSGVATYDWFNGAHVPGLPSTSMTGEALTP